MAISFWKDKKVFITGHTGFKGSWLCLWLSLLGAEVHGYALEPPTDPSLYELCNIDNLVSSTIADIRDIEKLKGTMRSADPDIVIHMAAQPLVRDSYKLPVETYSINVMGAVNMFEAVRICPRVKAVINVTTDKVYENREKRAGYEEKEALGGYDPYSNSKACSELVTSAYRSSYGIAVATARAGNVIGGGDWGTDRLVPDIIRGLLSGKKVNIRNPKAVRPWQHVLEPLSGYMLLAEKLYKYGPRFSGAWNFGPGRKDAKTVECIVEQLCSKWGHGASYSIIKGRHPHETGYLYLDSSKARKELKWKPRWDIDSAIDKVIEWTRAYEQRKDLKELIFSQIRQYSAT